MLLGCESPFEQMPVGSRAGKLLGRNTSLLTNPHHRFPEILRHFGDRHACNPRVGWLVVRQPVLFSVSMLWMTFPKPETSLSKEIYWCLP